MRERHTAENISNRVMDLLREFNITDRILAITTDNGANMIAACETLGRLLEKLCDERRRRGKGSLFPEVRFHCIAHGLNLSANEGIKLQDSVIDTLRDLIVKLRRPRAMEDFRNALCRHDSELKLDVATRWNSTYQMCQSFLSIQEEVNEHCLTTPGLTEYFFSDEDCKSVTSLVELLEPYQVATDDFAASNAPTVHLVLSGLSLFLRHLMQVSVESKVEWVRSAAVSMQKKLEEITKSWQDKEASVIARLLDPGLKDTELQGQEKTRAREAFLRVFQLYKGPPTPAPITASATGGASGGGLRQRVIAASNERRRTEVDEVIEYLSTASTTDMSVLAYWKNTSRYPTIRKMALDFLAIQASSVQSERENSVAKYVKPQQRNRLSGESMQAIICLKSWESLLSTSAEITLIED